VEAKDKKSPSTSRGAAHPNQGVSPRSGNAVGTPHVPSVGREEDNFAEYLRSRCNDIGASELAEALDRLEAPGVDELMPHSREMPSRPWASGDPLVTT
jgi:hypothetical protein